MGKSSKSSKGGKGKSSGKSTSKGKGGPSENSALCLERSVGCVREEGHWEEDWPQADVDMPQAKRRVTLSRPPVGVGVSQAWSVETWTVSSLTENAETRLKSWTSQEIPANTNLLGVTMTVPEGRAILGWCCVWIVSERWQLLVQLRPSARLEKHVALQLWTRYSVLSLEVVAILWKASFAVTLPVQIGDAKTWIEASMVPGSTPHLISRRWLSQHGFLDGGSLGMDVW